jgi:cell division transport system permease protein
MTVKTYQTVTKRLLQSTWNNMNRNQMLSFATIIVIILIVFFLNILGSINYLANYSIENINKKVDLTLELKEGIDINAPEVDQLKSELEQHGTQVVKISKEQALQDFKQILPDLGNFLETYRQNPLPASLYVTAKSIQDYEKISTIVENPQYKHMINFDQNENGFQNQKARIYKILDLSQAVKRFVILLQILFFLVSIIIILNTIQIVIHNRKDEIQIMKLVGASKPFIAAPFLLEGIFYGIIGVVIGLLSYVVLMHITYFNIHQLLPGIYIKSFISSLWNYYSKDILWIFMQQIITFMIIGVLSSMIALSRFLKLFYSPTQLLTNNREKV